MRDIASNISAVQMIAPAVQAATIMSEAIDLQGVNSAMVVINTGAIVSSGNFTATIQESDVPGDSPDQFAQVAAAELHGAFPSALEANSVVRVGYAGFKRYIRLVLTKNSGTSIAAGAMLVAGGATERPVS